MALKMASSAPPPISTSQGLRHQRQRPSAPRLAAAPVTLHTLLTPPVLLLILALPSLLLLGTPPAVHAQMSVVQPGVGEAAPPGGAGDGGGSSDGDGSSGGDDDAGDDGDGDSGGVGDGYVISAGGGISHVGRDRRT